MKTTTKAVQHTAGPWVFRAAAARELAFLRSLLPKRKPTTRKRKARK